MKSSVPEKFIHFFVFLRRLETQHAAQQKKLEATNRAQEQQQPTSIGAGVAKVTNKIGEGKTIEK